MASSPDRGYAFPTSMRDEPMRSRALRRAGCVEPLRGSGTDMKQLLCAALAALATFTGSAMDARYADADGDLVADTPANPAARVDPSTLVFAYTPVEDPAVYAKVWDGFIQHLARATGKRVQFFQVQGNAAQIEAMRAGRLHVAGFNPGSIPLAVNCAGFVPFAVMATRENRFGYAMELITHPGSGIHRLTDLRGKKIAFTSETSNSGFKAASLLLRDKFDMKAGRDYQPVFSGKHDNSILGVANGHYPAAAIADFVRLGMERRGLVKPGQTVVLYTSESFPTIAYGHAHNLTPELATKVRQAFFSFDWRGSALAGEFGRGDPPLEKFLTVSYRETWRIVREIDQAMGVSHACR